jgi:hypothetical protein
LERDRLGDKLRVQFGLVNFLDIDKNFALGALRQVLLQLLDLRALAADDDARTRGVELMPADLRRPRRFSLSSRSSRSSFG